VEDQQDEGRKILAKFQLPETLDLLLIQGRKLLSEPMVLAFTKLTSTIWNRVRYSATVLNRAFSSSWVASSPAFRVLRF